MRAQIEMWPAGWFARSRAWSGAMLIHGVAALAVMANWSRLSEPTEPAKPIMVRLVDAIRPPEPAPPPPTSARPRTDERTPPVMPLPTPVTPAPLAPSIPPVAVQPAPVVASTPAPVMPVLPAAAPEPLVEARFDADYLSNPKPPYPVASRRLGEEGVVRLRVQVGTEGQVLRVEIKEGSGYPRLDQSALETVARWHFVPARRGDRPVTTWVVVPIVFSLT